MSDSPLDFYEGICLFCGNKSQEDWHGRDCYEVCDCAGRKQYIEYAIILQNLAIEPEIRRKKLELEKRIEKHEQELSYMRANLKELK